LLGNAKNQNLIIDRQVFSKLSVLQQKILLELAGGPLCLDELSEKTGASIYTIGKQLSLLQLRTKYNPLSKKGITAPLVKKNKDAGIKTNYCLACKIDALKQSFRNSLLSFLFLLSSIIYGAFFFFCSYFLQ